MKIRTLLALTAILLIAPTLSQAKPSINNCTQTADDGTADSKDIKAVMWNINDDWSNFESAVEWDSGHNIGSTMRNYFANSAVICQYSPSAFEICGLLGGSAQSLPLGTIYICGDYLENLHSEEQKDRRACNAALLTKTFAESSLKSSRVSMDLGEAAFDYWEDRFGSSISYSACGI